MNDRDDWRTNPRTRAAKQATDILSLAGEARSWSSWSWSSSGTWMQTRKMYFSWKTAWCPTMSFGILIGLGIAIMTFVLYASYPSEEKKKGEERRKKRPVS
jgi:hypothetical protein